MTNYVVALPVSPLDVGAGFTVADWPPHVTIVPRFVSAVGAAQLVAVLQVAAGAHTPINVSISRDAYFGPDRDILVSLFADPGALQRLHLQLLAALEQECGIAFEEPQYSREGFLPHLTAASRDRILERETVQLSQLALVEMSPQNRAGIHSVVAAVDLGAPR